jgi:hypothetical protein
VQLAHSLKALVSSYSLSSDMLRTALPLKNLEPLNGTRMKEKKSTECVKLGAHLEFGYDDYFTKGNETSWRIGYQTQINLQRKRNQVLAVQKICVV